MHTFNVLSALLAATTLFHVSSAAVDAMNDEGSGSGSGDTGGGSFCSTACESCLDGVCYHCVAGMALHQGVCMLTCPAPWIPHWIETTSALVCIPPTDVEDNSGSGSGDDDLQPNLCNCGTDNSFPVCWVDQLVTLPSLCIARCLNIQHVVEGECPKEDDEGASVALNDRAQATSSDTSQKDAVLIALTAGLSLSVFVIIIMVVARRGRTSPQPKQLASSSATGVQLLLDPSSDGVRQSHV
eukprot:m.62789 g.62789  ORF g.62789 m.62789 type:complete len:241 (-) comp13934_c0_seq1:138-860(-)